MPVRFMNTCFLRPLWQCFIVTYAPPCLVIAIIKIASIHIFAADQYLHHPLFRIIRQMRNLGKIHLRQQIQFLACSAVLQSMFSLRHIISAANLTVKKTCIPFFEFKTHHRGCCIFRHFPVNFLYNLSCILSLLRFLLTRS